MAPRKRWLFLVLLAIGLFLRTYRINVNSLYGDELTMVYDTYSILKTGKSQTGQNFPLTFEMGAGRPGGYVYASVPFVLLFGPNEYGIRALSVVSGLGVILLIYLLSKYLFDEKIAYLAAFLSVVSPWDIALSRAGYEAHFALFLALLGIVAFLYSSKKPWLLLVSAFSWGLTWHTYPTYKLTLSLMIILLVWFKGRRVLLNKDVRRYLITGTCILLIFAILAASQTVFSTSESRFANINIFGKEELRENIVQNINQDRNVVKFPSLLSTIFHNKSHEYAKLLVGSYFNNFNLGFLFVNGDGNPRHNPSEMGYFYLIEILFISAGVLTLIKKSQVKNLKFTVGWILITPLATALLLEVHGLRNSFYLPPLILLSAYGLSRFLKSGRMLRLGVFGIWFLLFVFYLERVYFLAPGKHSEFWLAGVKEASQIAIKERNNQSWIILYDNSGNSKTAYPVYAAIDPQLVIIQKDQLVKKYDNVYITSEPPEPIPGSGLLIEVSGQNVNKYYVSEN